MTTTQRQDEATESFAIRRGLMEAAYAAMAAYLRERGLACDLAVPGTATRALRAHFPDGQARIFEIEVRDDTKYIRATRGFTD